MLKVLGIGEFEYDKDVTVLPIKIDDKVKYCIDEKHNVYNLFDSEIKPLAVKKKFNWNKGYVLETKTDFVELSIKTKGGFKSYWLPVDYLFAWANIVQYGLKTNEGKDYPEDFWSFYRTYNVYEYEGQMLIYSTYNGILPTK